MKDQEAGPFDFLLNEQVEKEIQDRILPSVSEYFDTYGSPLLRSLISSSKTTNTKGLPKYYATISVTKADLLAAGDRSTYPDMVRKNRTRAVRLDMIQGKIAAAAVAVRHLMSRGVYNSATNLVGPEKYGFNGIGEICGKRVKGVNYPGISRYCDSELHPASEWLDSNSPHCIISVFRKAARAFSVTESRLTEIFVSEGIHDALVGKAQTFRQYQSETGVSCEPAKITFEDVPVMRDEYCPEFHAYFIRRKLPYSDAPVLGLEISENSWFTLTPWKALDDLTWTRKLIVSANLFCDVPDSQASVIRLGE